MSIAQAKSFIEKAKSDKALLKEVMATSDLRARIKIINERGFVCTFKEIKQVQKEIVKQACLEVSIPFKPRLQDCPLIRCVIGSVEVG